MIWQCNECITRVSANVKQYLISLSNQLKGQFDDKIPRAALGQSVGCTEPSEPPTKPTWDDTGEDTYDLNDDNVFNGQDYDTILDNPYIQVSDGIDLAYSKPVCFSLLLSPVSFHQEV